MPTPAPEPRAALVALFGDVVGALDPAERVAAAVRARLPAGTRVRLLAVGKAAAAMALGATSALGDRLAGGLVVAPAVADLPPGLELQIGAHPRADARSEAAGRALLGAASAGGADRVLMLVSGGASALAELPAPGLALADVQSLVDRLMAGGAPIADLNAVRKHLSALKGGRLAAAAAAPVLTLVCSDVVGDDLATVGSGPTVPDPTTYADAVAACARWAADATGPARDHLDAGARGELGETPKQVRPGDEAMLVAGLATLVDEAAAASLHHLGRPAERVAQPLVGPVEAVAAQVADWLRRPGPRVVVAGGEPTVTLPPAPGVGGRARQLALLVAGALAGRPGWTLLVAGSDGIDGTADAAGAVVDGGTWARVRAAGIDPDRALAACDAGTALAAAGDALVTGPTGVNHADLVVGVVAPPVV